MEGASEEIVIVGAGICGLATALALHRKGIRSVVLERSECLRTTGSALLVLENGWRALAELGVATHLKETCSPLDRSKVAWLDKNKEIDPVLWSGEARCLKRTELINAFAHILPIDTIRFGCQIANISLDPATSYPALQLLDGSTITCKVVIGCDGSNSVVGKFLKLRPTHDFPSYSVRCLTRYPNGHKFLPEFEQLVRGDTACGRMPISNTEVFWFVRISSDSSYSRDPSEIRQLILQKMKGFPSDVVEMVANGELDSLSLTQLRYRAPWEYLFGSFRKGTVMVAGDARHLMCPFLSQGASLAIEDSVILARCLAPKLLHKNGNFAYEIGEALDEFTRERKVRVFMTSVQSYITGTFLISTSPSALVKKLICALILNTVFKNRGSHSKFDCGRL